MAETECVKISRGALNSIVLQTRKGGDKFCIKNHLPQYSYDTINIVLRKSLTRFTQMPITIISVMLWQNLRLGMA